MEEGIQTAIEMILTMLACYATLYTHFPTLISALPSLAPQLRKPQNKFKTYITRYLHHQITIRALCRYYYQYSTVHHPSSIIRIASLYATHSSP
jgi:hypothetical protein